MYPNQEVKETIHLLSFPKMWPLSFLFVDKIIVTPFTLIREEDYIKGLEKPFFYRELSCPSFDQEIGGLLSLFNKTSRPFSKQWLHVWSGT